MQTYESSRSLFSSLRSSARQRHLCRNEMKTHRASLSTTRHSPRLASLCPSGAFVAPFLVLWGGGAVSPLPQNLSGQFTHALEETKNPDVQPADEPKKIRRCQSLTECGTVPVRSASCCAPCALVCVCSAAAAERSRAAAKSDSTTSE